MYPTIQYRHKAHGLSLIELMVALAVSAIMLLGVTTVYTASQRTYQISSEMAELQENARFALHTLTTEIRKAGYTGCGNIDSIKLNILSQELPVGFATKGPDADDPIVVTFDQNNYISGHTHDGSSWTPAFDAGMEPEPDTFEPKTDAITIRNADACSASVLANNGATFTITESCDFKKGDAVIVTDCKTADMFTILNADGNPGKGPHTLTYGGTGNKELTTNYSRQNRSKVLRGNAIVYYIGNDDNGNLGLYERRLTSTGMTQRLLIPNVEDMVITYGLDTDGDATRTVDLAGQSATTVGGIDYQTAIDNYDAQATDTPWSRVVRVNMQLLLSSKPVGTTLKSFTFDNVDYSDTRSRRVFSTSINIRNRTP